MSIYILVILLILLFSFIFAFVPQTSYRLVRRLMVYHDYREKSLLVRLPKVIQTYVFLGALLSFVFLFILSRTDTDFEGVGILKLSAILSFALVLVMRVLTLCRYSPSSKLPLHDQPLFKRDLESFLFSLILSSFATVMLSFFYRLLFETERLSFDFTVTGLGIWTLIYQVLVMAFVFLVLTVFGELLLHFGGVKACLRDKPPAKSI